MSYKRKKKNKYKRLFISILSLALVTLIFTAYTKKPMIASSSDKVKNGLDTLNSLEKKDVSMVENRIDEIKKDMDKEKEKENNKENSEVQNGESNYKKVFESTVFMGDSLVEPLSEYEFLETSSVVALKGRDVLKAKQDIPKVVSLSPSKIVMLYGMNDLLLFDSKEEFIKNYEILIKSIKQQLPNSQIYINSIFPVKEFASNKKPKFKRYKEFNDALREMCKSLSIEFVDTTYLIEGNGKLYEQDGVHLIADFYPQWLNVYSKK